MKTRLPEAFDALETEAMQRLQAMTSGKMLMQAEQAQLLNLTLGLLGLSRLLHRSLQYYAQPSLYRLHAQDDAMSRPILDDSGGTASGALAKAAQIHIPTHVFVNP